MTSRSTEIGLTEARRRYGDRIRVDGNTTTTPVPGPGVESTPAAADTTPPAETAPRRPKPDPSQGSGRTTGAPVDRGTEEAIRRFGSDRVAQARSGYYPTNGNDAA